MSEAVVTVSPKRQYLGILSPTTPATTAPEDREGQTFMALPMLAITPLTTSGIIITIL